MRKKYKIIFIENYCIVILKSYTGFFSEIPKIESELKLKNYSGEIYVDQLISNGFSENRFIKLIFSDDKIKRNSCEKILNIDDKIKKISQKYYLKNLEIIENSVLNRNQKFLYKKSKIL